MSSSTSDKPEGSPAWQGNSSMMMLDKDEADLVGEEAEWRRQLDSSTRHRR
jgi:hypothetical protein